VYPTGKDVVYVKGQFSCRWMVDDDDDDCYSDLDIDHGVQAEIRHVDGSADEVCASLV
jgi:hypothetical protein